MSPATMKRLLALPPAERAEIAMVLWESLDEVAEKAARAVEAGDAESVSAYFADLAAREPDWAAVDEMLVEAGDLSADDVTWARSLLGLDGTNTDAA